MEPPSAAVQTRPTDPRLRTYDPPPSTHLPDPSRAPPSVPPPDQGAIMTQPMYPRSGPSGSSRPSAGRLDHWKKDIRIAGDLFKGIYFFVQIPTPFRNDHTTCRLIASQGGECYVDPRDAKINFIILNSPGEVYQVAVPPFRQPVNKHDTLRMSEWTEEDLVITFTPVLGGRFRSDYRQKTVLRPGWIEACMKRGKFIDFTPWRVRGVVADDVNDTPYPYVRIPPTVSSHTRQTGPVAPNPYSHSAHVNNRESSHSSPHIRMPQARYPDSAGSAFIVNRQANVASRADPISYPYPPILDLQSLSNGSTAQAQDGYRKELYPYDPQWRHEKGPATILPDRRRRRSSSSSQQDETVVTPPPSDLPLKDSSADIHLAEHAKQTNGTTVRFEDPPLDAASSKPSLSSGSLATQKANPNELFFAIDGIPAGFAVLCPPHKKRIYEMFITEIGGGVIEPLESAMFIIFPQTDDLGDSIDDMDDSCFEDTARDRDEMFEFLREVQKSKWRMIVRGDWIDECVTTGSLEDPRDYLVVLDDQ